MLTGEALNYRANVSDPNYFPVCDRRDQKALVLLDRNHGARPLTSSLASHENQSGRFPFVMTMRRRSVMAS